jgi:DNA-binding LacI/PurR family transcriptional regulator
MAEPPASKRPRVTLQDVATRAGVSTTTASLVLQSKGQISQATRDRVRDAAQLVGYEFRHRSVGTNDAIHRAVYFIVDDLANPYFHELYKSIQWPLQQRGLLLSLVSSEDSPELQRQLIGTAAAVGASAILLAPASGTLKEHIDGALLPDVPLILTVRNPGFTEFSFVGANPMLGMMMATEHLIELGHSRIAFVGGNPKNAAFSERYAGFVSTMTRHGLDVAKHYIDSGQTSVAFGRLHALQLLKGNEPPTAIIGYNDMVAIGVLRALAELGLKPGRDIAVVGYDDIGEARDSSVSLTTISTPADLMGRMVAEEVLRQIGASDRHPINMTLPPTLVVRESSVRNEASVKLNE